MRMKPIFLLVVALSLLSACSRAEEQSESTQDIAPEFTLKGLKGETLVLSDMLENKMVVLDFWASWCPHCVKAIPDLEKFYQENKDKVEVIGINVGEKQEIVEEFIQQKGISYPVALDSNNWVAKLYKVVGIPTFVAVDKNKKILYYGHSLEQMKDKIKF